MKRFVSMRSFVVVLLLLLLVPVVAWAVTRGAATNRKSFAKPGNCTDANVAAWFDFEDASGNLTVPTGCAAAATVMTANGTPTYGVAAPAGLGFAASFDANGDYFGPAGDVDALDFGTSNAVVEGWIRRTASNAGGVDQQIVGKGRASIGGWELYLASNGTAATFDVGDGTEQCTAVDASVSFTDGQWHRIRGTFVFATATCTIQVDSNAVVTTTVGAFTSVGNTAAPRIARATGGGAGTEGFVGDIADLRITIGNATNNISTGVTSQRTPSHDLFGNYVSSAAWDHKQNSPAGCGEPNSAMWLNMDDASGNLTVPAGCAASGVAFVASGNPVYGTEAGVPSGLRKAITFDGTGDFFETAADEATLDIGSSDFVLEGWVYTTTDVGNQVIYNKGVYSTSEGVIFYINAGALRLEMGSTGGAQICVVPSAGAVSTNMWHYVRAAWVNSTHTCSASMDGGTVSSVVAATLSSIDTANRAAIGTGLNANGTSNGTTLFGAIADLRLTVGNATNQQFISPVPTFTRATASTKCVGGVVSSVASGSVVFTAPVVSGGSCTGTTGFYSGLSGIFLALNNEDLTTAGGWGPDACMTVTADTTDVTAPDGSNNAEKFVASACSANVPFVGRDLVTASAQTFTETIWLRSNDDTANTVKLKLTEIGVLDYFSAVEVTSSWQRFTFTQALASAVTSVRVGLVADGTDNPTIYAWREQVYAKLVQLPLDPAVAGTAVTINSDKLQYAVPGLAYEDFTAMAWSYHETVNNVDNLIELVTISGTSTNDGAICRIQAGAISITDPFTYTASFGAPGAAATWSHYAYVVKSGSQIVYLNGGQSGSEATNAYTTPTGGGTVSIGQSMAAAVGGNKILRNVHVWQGRLSPTQIRAVYNSERGSLALHERPIDKARVMFASIAPDWLSDALFPYIQSEEERLRDDIRYVNSTSFPKMAFSLDGEGNAHQAAP